MIRCGDSGFRRLDQTVVVYGTQLLLSMVKTIDIVIPLVGTMTLT
jgi:hypothetical protein